MNIFLNHLKHLFNLNEMFVSNKSEIDCFLEKFSQILF